MNWENLTTETTARLIEQRDSLKDQLGNWLPVGRITNSADRRVAQARIAKINRELAKRQAQRRRWEEQLDSMAEPFR